MLPTLQYSKFYHIYNCGINHENLFNSQLNYEVFLKDYDKYISPIAETYAWVLMKNHFHFLVRIKDPDEIGHYKKLATDSSNKEDRFQTNKLSQVLSIELEDNQNDLIFKVPDPTRHFSHLFNKYAKYFNKFSSRSGALFERPFKRIEINSDIYLLRLVVYINTNPVHHGFCANFEDYPWSSYKIILSSEKTKINRQEVINWFENVENFIAVHKMKSILYDNMKELLLEDL